jgi:hypothetical protein
MRSGYDTGGRWRVRHSRPGGPTCNSTDRQVGVRHSRLGSRRSGRTGTSTLRRTGPYSYLFPARSQQLGRAALQQPGAGLGCGERSGCAVSASDMLLLGTHRPVTNRRPDRTTISGRVSHGATRFGRQTNHSDVDDHVSTIRLSQGQGQRVGVPQITAVYRRDHQ